MDFIPFTSEPVNRNSRIQTKDVNSSATKKKRPVDDDSQVCRLVIFCFCRK